MTRALPFELFLGLRYLRARGQRTNLSLFVWIGVGGVFLGVAALIVVLAVTLKEGADATEDDIRGFLRERVAAYKVPKKVLFFADGEIPMTGSETKVRDPELLALVQARLAEERD